MTNFRTKILYRHSDNGRWLKFLIYTNVPRSRTKGNRITADRWGRMLRDLGHQVTVINQFNPCSPKHRAADCLIAIHAVHSHETIVAFKQQNRPEQNRDRSVILCLSGTDIHRDMQGDRGAKNKRKAAESIEIADRIIVLEPVCRRHLSVKSNRKTDVVIQSAIPVARKPAPLKNSFEVSILGHLRDEKDPLLTAIAARELPVDSKIQIRHLGGAYTAQWRAKAETETKNNDRYIWLGVRSHGEAQRRLARSRLTVLSSRCEGGPSVFSEAVINGVPILATKIDASIGLLGKGYPGLFDVGDVQNLTRLLHRAESDDKFYKRLMTAIWKLKPKFHPQSEKKALCKAIQGA